MVAELLKQLKDLPTWMGITIGLVIAFGLERYREYFQYRREVRKQIREREERERSRREEFQRENLIKLQKLLIILANESLDLSYLVAENLHLVYENKLYLKYLKARFNIIYLRERVIDDVLRETVKQFMRTCHELAFHGSESTITPKLDGATIQQRVDVVNEALKTVTIEIGKALRSYL